MGDRAVNSAGPLADAPDVPSSLRPGLRALIALAATGVVVASLVLLNDWGSVFGVLSATRSVSAGQPPLPADAAATPLATPEVAPAGEGGFTVLLRQEGTGEPVGWDPCRPLRYVVNDEYAPPSGQYLVQSAVAELQRLTGQVFVPEGTTQEEPSDRRAAVQKDRYGDRWAPVLIAWSEPGAASGLAGPVAGYAGPQAVDGAQPDTQRYVTGQVVLDGPQLGELAAGSAGLARARGVLLHELAHLMGLDHVEDRAELMYPSTTLLGVDFAEGDRRGLAAVSGRPCRTDW